eukprot:UN32637
MVFEHTCLQSVYRIMHMSTDELVCGAADKSIYIFVRKDPLADSWTLKKTLREHSSTVYDCCEISPVEFASGSYDNIRIWQRDDITSTDFRRVSMLTGISSGTYSLLLLPTGQLCSGSGDHSVKLWTRDSANSTNWTCTFSIKSHSNTVWRMGYFPSTNEIITLGYKDVIIWNLSEDKKQLVQKGHINCIDSYAMSPITQTEEIITFSYAGKNAKFWVRPKKGSGSDEWTVSKQMVLNNSYVYASVFLPSGNFVVGCASSPYAIDIYDTATDARKDILFVNPKRIFEKLDEKLVEFEKAEKEDKLGDCIAINLKIQSILQDVDKVMQLGEKRAELELERAKQDVEKLKVKIKNLEDEIKVTRKTLGEKEEFVT